MKWYLHFSSSLAIFFKQIVKLTVLSIMLLVYVMILVERVKIIFDSRIFPLYFANNHNFKDKPGRGKDKKTRKRREGKRNIPRSFIRKEKLPGAEAS